MNAQQASSLVDLNAVLEAALSTDLESPVHVVASTRQLSDYSSSFRIEDVSVGLEDGQVVQLVLKDLSWNTMLDGARSIRSRHGHDPVREVAVYRRLLPAAPAGPPRYVGSFTDPVTGSEWLFLERVPGLQLRHTGDESAWRAPRQRGSVTSTRTFSGAGGLGEAVALRLPCWNADWLRWILSDARERVRREPHYDRAAFARIEAAHEVIVDRLIRLPSTVIHGQLYPANVIVGSTSGHERVCVLDWETAAIGPGIIDVAALTEGSWSADERSALLHAYLVARDGVTTPESEESAGVDLVCARVQMALGMVGIDSSAIPSDMTADWLGRAAALVEELPW